MTPKHIPMQRSKCFCTDVSGNFLNIFDWKSVTTSSNKINHPKWLISIKARNHLNNLVLRMRITCDNRLWLSRKKQQTKEWRKQENQESGHLPILSFLYILYSCINEITIIFFYFWSMVNSFKISSTPRVKGKATNIVKLEMWWNLYRHLYLRSNLNKPHSTLSEAFVKSKHIIKIAICWFVGFSCISCNVKIISFAVLEMWNFFSYWVQDETTKYLLVYE